MWETSHLLGVSKGLLSDRDQAWVNELRVRIPEWEGQCCWVVRLDGHHGLLRLYNFWTTKNILKMGKGMKTYQSFLSDFKLSPSSITFSNWPPFLSGWVFSLLSQALASAAKLGASLHGLSSVDRPFPLPLDFSCRWVYFCSFVERVVRLTAPTNASQVQVQCSQKDLGVSPATVCSTGWSLHYIYFGSHMSLKGSGFTCCFIQILNNCWWWKDCFVVTVIVRKLVTKK